MDVRDGRTYFVDFTAEVGFTKSRPTRLALIEVTNGLGDGDTAIDAVINPDGTVLLGAERSGTGDGRVYHIHFTASDFEGSASGVVDVCVQHDKKSDAIDGDELFDSTQ